MEPDKRQDTNTGIAGEIAINGIAAEEKRSTGLRNAFIMLLVFVGIWQLAALYYNHALLLPGPLLTGKALIRAVSNPEVWENLLITMRRVLSGFAIAVTIGVPLGFLMGFSRTAMQMMEPMINSIRQVPVMAWVPLTIVWFGLGDGPTIFLIAFSGLFPVLLNAVAGVQSISQDYYNAARSMGASGWTILRRIIIPGSLPDVLTGMRLALSTGWMSVI